MPIYTPGKLTLAKTYVGIDDPDAQAYIAAVEAADQIASPGIGALETATKVAIHSFVKGCKNDGIWPALKASCILAGARTKEGAIVPLANASNSAPTLNGTAGGWNYNRKTGLQGNGTNNYINSGRNNNADPQNSKHLAVFVGSAATGNTTQVFIGSDTVVQEGVSLIYKDGAADAGNEKIVYQVNQNFATTESAAANSAFSTGLIAASRSNPSNFVGRVSLANSTYTQVSETPQSKNITVFARTPDNPARFSNARLAFYSIGESLDLALLDARVSALITAIGAAF